MIHHHWRIVWWWQWVGVLSDIVWIDNCNKLFYLIDERDSLLTRIQCKVRANTFLTSSNCFAFTRIVILGQTALLVFPCIAIGCVQYSPENSATDVLITFCEICGLQNEKQLQSHLAAEFTLSNREDKVIVKDLSDFPYLDVSWNLSHSSYISNINTHIFPRAFVSAYPHPVRSLREPRILHSSPERGEGEELQGHRWGQAGIPSQPTHTRYAWAGNKGGYGRVLNIKEEWSVRNKDNNL